MTPPISLQIAPPEWCASCDICCRFPEKDSFLAPYFTDDEIVSAIKNGIEAHYFPNKTGCKITLHPYKRGGYICPAFNPLSGQCRIYNVRPFDCMLYPFAVMWDATGKEIVLGMDSKCPYVRDPKGAQNLQETSIEIASTIESPSLLYLFTLNKGLIGPCQDDVLALMVLKILTSRFVLH